MKRLLVVFMAGIFAAGSGFCLGEDTLGATIDGRKVILHPDGTWEFKRRVTEGLPETLALADFEKANLPVDIEAGQMNKRVKFTLHVRNPTARPVKSWKATLTVKNLYNEVLATAKIIEDKAGLDPGGTQSVDIFIEDNRYADDDPYDLVVVHEQDSLKVLLLDVKIVQ